MPIINPYRNKATGAETPFFHNSGSLLEIDSPCPWEHISLDYRTVPAFDNPELISDVHVFVMKTDSAPSSARWRRHGKWYQNTFTAGDIGIHPAGPVDLMESKDTRNAIIVGIDNAAITYACAGFEVPEDFEFQLVLPAHDELIAACLRALLHEARNGYRFGELYGDAVSTTIAAHYLLHYGTRKVKIHEARGGLSRQALSTVIEYMEANAHRRVRLVELASLVHLSAYHFSRLFKQSTGLSPYQYLLRTRVKLARKLMNNGDVTLKEISERVGFYDASHFSRAFKRVTGVRAVDVFKQSEE